MSTTFSVLKHLHYFLDFHPTGQGLGYAIILQCIQPQDLSALPTLEQVVRRFPGTCKRFLEEKGWQNLGLNLAEEGLEAALWDLDRDGVQELLLRNRELCVLFRYDGIGDRMEYLGQVEDTYLVLRDETGALVLLDQHAAHERVLFARFTTRGYRGARQMLALPLELSLRAPESARWLELKDMLEGLGFEGELSGARLAVSAMPAMLERAAAEDFLRSCLAGGRDDFSRHFAQMACKAAVKAGQRLSPDEALKLVSEWLAVPDREYCPHGRPAVLRWDAQALEKLFKRRQP